MPMTEIEDRYPDSPAFRAIQPLRIPGGWHVQVNKLQVEPDDELGAFGDETLFHAVNETRRFAIDVTFRAEDEGPKRFVLTVEYQPYPRTEKGRRAKEGAFRMTGDAETVGEREIEDPAEMIERLEHWIARCTVWTREHD